MADLELRDTTTLGETMRRRAERSPAMQYFNVFDETVTYARLWEQAVGSWFAKHSPKRS